MTQDLQHLRQQQLQNLVGKRNELLILCNEVGLRVHFNHDAGLKVICNLSNNQSRRGLTTLTLRKRLESLHADDLQSLVVVTLSFDEGVLDIHHSGASLLTQCLDVGKCVVSHF